MTSSLTPERIEAIRAREKAATPGPWKPDGSENDEEPFIPLAHARLIISGDNQNGMWDDWEFIAHARTDIPDLLAALDERDARIAELTAQRDFARLERDKFDHERGDWTGKKCAVCKGSGADEDNHACTNCAGTGEQWSTWKERADTAECELAETRKMLADIADLARV